MFLKGFLEDILVQFYFKYLRNKQYVDLLIGNIFIFIVFLYYIYIMCIIYVYVYWLIIFNIMCLKIKKEK